MLIDDDPGIRAALRATLERDAGIVVVGDSPRGDMVIELAEQHRPDVVLMGLNIAGIDGVQASLALKEEFPGIDVVMLSVPRRGAPTGARRGATGRSDLGAAPVGALAELDSR